MLSCFSCIGFFAAQWTGAHQGPLSMGFSRQEYWSRLPFPLPGDLDPGTKPKSSISPALQVDSLLLSHQGNPLNTMLKVKSRMTGYRIAINILVVYPCDRVADWYIQFVDATQHHKRVYTA